MASFTDTITVDTPCPFCGCETASYWQSDTDPGDQGWVRTCNHGDYA